MTDDHQPLRSVSDGIGRLERDLEQQALQAHLLASVKTSEQAQGLSDRVTVGERTVSAIDQRLETLELERAQVIGAWRLMRFVLGASLLSLLVNIVALAGVISGAIR